MKSYATLFFIFLFLNSFGQFPAEKTLFQIVGNGKIGFMNVVKKELILYSNEFEGSINPGQFWRKQDHFSWGIMDPYDN